MKGLIIDEPWLGLILLGEKTWEMRTGTWKYHGLIGLIRKKSGRVVGAAVLVDNRPPLKRPVPHTQPGAITSVNLSEDVAAQVQRQSAT